MNITISRRALIAGVAGIVAAVIGVMIYAVVAGSAGTEPQQLRVVVAGNLGAVVYADDETHKLEAASGSDSANFMVRKSISVTVTSTGTAPSCQITDASGKVLTDQTGPTPSVVEQVPTYENATCSFTIR